MQTLSRVLYIVTMLVVVWMMVAIMSGLSRPPGRIGDDLKSEEKSRAFRDTLTGMLSGSPILMGYRTFDAGEHGGKLVFEGGAYTFLDRDDPSGFQTYAFRFDGERYVAAVPAASARLQQFFSRYDAAIPDGPVSAAGECTDPRPGTAATQDGIPLKTSLLCKLPSATPGGRMAAIGIVDPDPTSLPLENGDATCRREVEHWLSLERFRDIEIVFCVVVDRIPDPEAYSDESWMDIIFYQKRGTRLMNMRGTTRNFQRI